MTEVFKTKCELIVEEVVSSKSGKPYNRICIKVGDYEIRSIGSRGGLLIPTADQLYIIQSKSKSSV